MGVRMKDNDSKALSGQVAVVTGAGRGIGAAIASGLAFLGARVVLCGRTTEPLETAATRIAASGGQAKVMPCDVSSIGSVKALAAFVEKNFARADILVNNAGVGS